MRKLLALTTILALSTGCTAGEVGVWLFLFDNVEVDVGDQDCAENFNSADCAATPTGGSDWDVDVSGEQSPGAMFGEITDGPSGEAYLVIGGEVYVGTKAGGVYSFEWESFDNTEESNTHTPSGYSLSEQNDSSVLTTIRFDRSGRSLTGNQETVAMTERTIRETDTWNYDGSGAPTYGAIQNEAYSYIDGDADNYYDSQDCSASMCEVNIVSEITYSSAFTATKTDLDHAAFDGVDGAGQDPGVPNN